MLHLDRKKTDFSAKWRSYFDNKFRENKEYNPRVEWEWSKFAGAKRQYFTIDDYKVVTCEDMTNLPKSLDQESVNLMTAHLGTEEHKEVIKKMKTTKKSQCGGDCACEDGNVELKNKLSQIDLVGSMMATQKSIETLPEELKCCFHRKIECGKDCGWNPDKCRNR